MSAPSINRRRVLAGLLPAGIALSAPRTFASARLRFDDGVFVHGVASGDPLAERVIIWSRVTGARGAEGAYGWEVATDPGFKHIVREGVALTGPHRDWTLKVDVDGLHPGRRYWYRFESAATRSPPGRTCTLPDGRVESYTLAACACSNYPAGYFNAYRALAARDDVDLVVHLGDYIYEYGVGGYASGRASALGRTVQPVHATVTLSDYRARYAHYRRDPDLQAVHARHPFIAIWDDHESANDPWQHGAENHDPDTEGDWFLRREAATRAWYEWLPAREPADRPWLKAWRAFDIGDLATLAVVETRHVARSRQLGPEDAGGDPAALVHALANPGRRLLGQDQLDWLERTWSASAARGAPWQLLGSQTIVAPVTAPDLARALDKAERSRLPKALQARLDYTRHGLPYNLDAWDGYPAARERLYNLMAEHTRHPVVLSGDSHTAWANDLPDGNGVSRGVEVGVTAITSPGIDEVLRLREGRGAELFRAVNPHVRWMDSRRKGFAVVTLTPGEMRAGFHFVDTITARDFRAFEAHHAYARAGGPSGRLRYAR